MNFAKLTKPVGIALSIALFVTTWNLPLTGLAVEGQQALAVTLFTVVWWAFGIMHPAYTTLLLFVLYAVLGLAPLPVIFRLWTTPLIWLTIGAFLIAAAVTKTGLARRVAYIFLVHANSYKSIVVLAFVLGFLLSLLIPSPFPRTLLIMTIVAVMLRQAGADDRDARSLGFAVFMSSTATTTILLTGDAILNVAAAALSSVRVGWLEWARYMAVPGIVASLLMMGLFFVVFPQRGVLSVSADILTRERAALGSVSRTEKITLAWVLIALSLWATDFLHGVDPAWVALTVAVGLALPYIGGVLDGNDLVSGVNWGILIFVVGALAIGAVASETGLAAWLTTLFLPATPSDNPYTFAALVTAVTMFVHLFVGSALTTLGVIAPPMVEYARSAGWNPLFPVLLIYSAAALQYLFPFQQVSILLGAGEIGKYGTRETLRFGIPLTFVVFGFTVLFQVTWWLWVGLI